MVHDEEIRKMRKQFGHIGGLKSASQRQANVKQKSTPSSSSSVSKEKKKEKEKRKEEAHLAANKSRPLLDGKPPQTDYQKLVKHVFETYKVRYQANYPFGAEDGRIVKWVLQNWTVEECMALWDQFIGKRWDFEKNGRMIKLPHSLRNFQTKVRILLEEGTYKSKAKQYAEQTTQTTTNVPTLATATNQILKTVP